MVAKSSPEMPMTPLPVLSMIVLSITMLGEFLSANVSTPFLLFMVKGMGFDAAWSEVAFWTGVLVSTFFLTQFLTSLLWATIAEKHGQRIVITLSLLGSGVTCALFGLSSSLSQAICIRLLQGIFAGAVGVARGCVTVVTDPSNEGRAYAVLGFSWGFGGVAGAIIGGAFEQPAQKWPSVFGNSSIFTTFPYLLPCVLAAVVTLLGSFLSLFLAPDCGPRQGAIQLPIEKNNNLGIRTPIPEEDSASPGPLFQEPAPEPRTSVGKLQKRIQRKVSSLFGGARGADTESVSRPVSLASPRRDSESVTPGLRVGSAYGYSNSAYRERLASIASRRRRMSASSRRMSLTGRRSSAYDPALRVSNYSAAAPDATENTDLNFTQRLLMANENAVTNIADLWVAAAMNADNDDVFASDEDIESDDEDMDFGDPSAGTADEDDEQRASEVFGTPRGRRSTTFELGTPGSGRPARRTSGSAFSHRYGATRRASTGIPIYRTISNTSALLGPSEGATPVSRRLSANMPAIFANPGVCTPPAVLDAQQLLMADAEAYTASPALQTDSLAPIIESRRMSLHESGPNADLEAFAEKPPSLASQLPIYVILQYGLLALHTTTHDQVFMSYLVTDYSSGGLNLNAGHFAELIALMCLAQIVYQFYIYPNIGPPRGRFSHLAMFRLGSFLFIPSYLTVVLYRLPFASEGNDGNFMLMTGKNSNAMRFAGITFAYTAVSILLNYMTPPFAISYANGIAQSIVSLARCFGPVLGGWLWSIGTQDNPEGYSLGFIVCAAVCVLALAQSFMIR
ncbi:hypothetical protein FISHEDRAFT_45431 [Fistulina hepatica ATCC 64428]|uniref:Major facilitator superfamily MFS-1 n=1 Tax=Fistulina hepatica ATCC 64428 TaxID=1128425 RepID=A0A0D7A9N0_9AGAR|nr:hypothetical protein FISHEDRAFT_45431 [Fistulina hepatica ATCC 64428]